jgi:hypothetical protein
MNRLLLPARLAAIPLLLTAGRFARAATLRVPEQYSTISSAQIAAQDGDEIDIGPGTYETNLYVTKQITLRGAGATRTVIAAKDANPTVTVPIGANVQLRDLAVVNGRVGVSGYGGGVANGGTVTMDRCVIAQCGATSGGGFANLGGAVATLTDCVLSGNSSVNGAGVYNNGNLTINRCTLMDNVATGSGGGIYNAGTTTLKGSTVSGNSAADGGGLYNASGVTVNLNNVTTAFNSASASGGGFKNAGTLHMTNSILANNTAPSGPDGSGPLTVQQGVNVTFDLILNTSGINGTTVGGGNILGQNPVLGGLSYNTDTRAFYPSRLATGAAGVPDGAFTGPPDEAFAGLGADGVVYDFGADVVQNEPGPDFNVYEVDYGASEFAAMDVLVSLDGIHFVSVKTTEGPLVPIPGDAAHGNPDYSRSYDLAAARLPYVRYIKVQGTGTGVAGGTNGFDLDAVGSIWSPTVPVPTLTHMLLPASPAIDAGGGGMETSDQRGILRNQDGNSDNTVQADMGAVEVQRTYVVTTTDDTGAGSLRAAIETNNVLGIGDGRITFNIPGPAPHVIQPLSAITTQRPVFIDGWSQPGYSGTPLIEIDGSMAPAGTNGLTIRGQGSVVRGLAIGGFAGGSAYGIICSAGTPTGLTQSRIYRNAIGVNTLGTTGHANQGGIQAVAGGYQIGSNLDGVNDEAEGNIISGNDTYGVYLVVSGNVIAGNKIGTDVSGRVAIPNGRAGIVLVAGTDNAIRRNSIAFNGGLGIDISGNGVTLNDDQDADGGPNGLQNFPVLSALAPRSDSTRLTVEMSAAPRTTYAIEFFENDSSDPSGYGEGQWYLGAASLTTDAHGTATATLDLPALSRGAYITATATDPDGNTSEFSRAAAAAVTYPDAVRALSLAAGLKAAEPVDVARFAFGAPVVSLASAIRVARMAAGTDANP